MPCFHQFLLATAFIAVLDTSLKTNPTIIQRDLIWTVIVFAGIALWDHLAECSGENPAPEKI